MIALGAHAEVGIRMMRLAMPLAHGLVRPVATRGNHSDFELL
jgi:hypothetical protein